MRVKDIVRLCMSFNRITIKARMSIFGKYRDIMITSFLVKNGRANIDDNLVLLSEDVIELDSNDEGIILTIRGCE
nr:MAG TPA: hypothetical protein [Caudoviricetes sp.]